MDRLTLAAQAGDFNELYACIQDKEALNLKSIDEAELVDTPLHIAARAGHADFAMAVMYFKPSWGRKLNQDMYSPMHIAVQNGDIDVVFALLEVDKGLVRVKGRYGYTPLHSAAKEGNTVLLARFLEDCPTCIEDVTIQKETALHVAALNDKWEALEILAHFLERTHLYCKDSRRYILDSKDRNGNTVLHIAASETKPQMVKLLLDYNAKTKGKNKGGYTASQLLERQSSGTQERKMCLAHIRKAESKIPSLNVIETVYGVGYFFWHNTRSEENFRLKVTFYERMVMILTGKIATMPSDQINAVLVVLALILTATYQALLSPPGGVYQAEYSANQTSADEKHVGESIMDVFTFMIFHNLNFEVFVITSFFTVVFLFVLSTSPVIALFAELLLSSLMWCILIAQLIIEPTTAPGDLFKGQVLAALSFIGLWAGMEVFRWFVTFCILNPPTISFFRKLFDKL